MKKPNFSEINPLLGAGSLTEASPITGNPFLTNEGIEIKGVLRERRCTRSKTI